MGRGASAQILSHVLRDRLGGPRLVTGKVVCTGLSAPGSLAGSAISGWRRVKSRLFPVLIYSSIFRDSGRIRPWNGG